MPDRWDEEARKLADYVLSYGWTHEEHERRIAAALRAAYREGYEQAIANHCGADPARKEEVLGEDD